MDQKPVVLVTDPPQIERSEQLEPYAQVHWLNDLSARDLDRLLPFIDCILVQTWWPDELTSRRLSQMTRLRFIQSGYAGVNHIPFAYIDKRVIVSSNAGGFSLGVAEFALSLVVAAAKRVVKLDLELRSGDFRPSRWPDLVREIKPLSGGTLGILGYGGIGKAVGAMGKALGMTVIAFSRHQTEGRDVETFVGREGLLQVLHRSDLAVISLPLSRLTLGLIGASELTAMRTNAVLINVARAEIVNEEAVYRHLRRNPQFTYATDVWQIKQGKETFSSKFPLLKLKNFIGTPHVAGGSSSLTGEPGRTAAENLIRYLKGEKPENVVDPSEYA